METFREDGRDAAGSLQTGAAPNAALGGLALRENLNMLDPRVRALAGDVGDVAAWAERNPESWEFIVGRCRELVAAGRRFPFRMVMEEARYHAAPVEGGRLFKLPNDYAPVLQRMACAEVPGMRALVEKRKSKYDEVLA